MGHLCSIPGTKDFFISYGDHPEWGTSHTVWGEVRQLPVCMPACLPVWRAGLVRRGLRLQWQRRLSPTSLRVCLPNCRCLRCPASLPRLCVQLENEWLAVDLIISQDYKTVTHPEHGACCGTCFFAAQGPVGLPVLLLWGCLSV